MSISSSPLGPEQAKALEQAKQHHARAVELLVLCDKAALEYPEAKQVCADLFTQIQQIEQVFFDATGQPIRLGK